MLLSLAPVMRGRSDPQSSCPPLGLFLLASGSQVLCQFVFVRLLYFAEFGAQIADRLTSDY